jgi:hypothetical protein
MKAKRCDNETIEIMYFMPVKEETTYYALNDLANKPDLVILLPTHEYPFTVEMSLVFLETCHDNRSAKAVIYWLNHYIDEIKRRFPDV